MPPKPLSALLPPPPRDQIEIVIPEFMAFIRKHLKQLDLPFEQFYSAISQFAAERPEVFRGDFSAEQLIQHPTDWLKRIVHYIAQVERPSLSQAKQDLVIQLLNHSYCTSEQLTIFMTLGQNFNTALLIKDLSEISQKNRAAENLSLWSMIEKSRQATLLQLVEYHAQDCLQKGSHGFNLNELALTVYGLAELLLPTSYPEKPAAQKESAAKNSDEQDVTEEAPTGANLHQDAAKLSIDEKPSELIEKLLNCLCRHVDAFHHSKQSRGKAYLSDCPQSNMLVRGFSHLGLRWTTLSSKQRDAFDQIIESGIHDPEAKIITLVSLIHALSHLAWPIASATFQNTLAVFYAHHDLFLLTQEQLRRLYFALAQAGFFWSMLDKKFQSLSLSLLQQQIKTSPPYELKQLARIFSSAAALALTPPMPNTLAKIDLAAKKQLQELFDLLASEIKQQIKDVAPEQIGDSVYSQIFYAALLLEQKLLLRVLDKDYVERTQTSHASASEDSLYRFIKDILPACTPPGLHYTVHNNYMINGRPADFVITNNADGSIVAIIEWDGPFHFNQNADSYIPTVHTHMRNALLGQLNVPLALIAYFQIRDFTYEKEEAFLESVLKNLLLAQPPISHLYSGMRIADFEAAAKRETIERTRLRQAAAQVRGPAPPPPAVSAWGRRGVSASAPLDDLLNEKNFPELPHAISKTPVVKSQNETTSATTAWAPSSNSSAPLCLLGAPSKGKITLIPMEKSPWKKVNTGKRPPTTQPDFPVSDFPPLGTSLPKP